MRKGRFLKYLLAMVMAVSTAGSAVAQEKNLKLYFNEFTTGNQGVPELTMKGDVPNANENVSVSQSGFDWASKYQVFLLNRQNCQDRVVANKVTVNGKEKSQASVSLTNFKYEVKQIQWNVMNDLFSDNLIGWTKTLQVSGISTPYTGSAKTGTTGSWAVFGKEMSFGKENLPGTNANLGFKGLSSFSIEEVNKWIIISRDTKLDDNCRVFVKAGQKGTAEPGANDWAFQVTYYEPSLSLSGIPSMMFLGQERNFTSGDYSVSHTGAFNFTLESVVSSEPEVIFIDANGKMTAKNVGSSTITVTMKDGNKVITASKVIDVKTLTPQEGVHYYHNNNSRNSIKFSELNHTDGDYTFSTPDKMDGDFKCLGVFKSATNNDYKVGAKVIDFPMSAPAYTTVTAPFDFKLTNSQTGLNVFDDFGGEIIITEDYNNLSLITDNSASTGSVYKRWKDFFIGTSQSVANNTTLINNSDKASAVKDKTFHMILMSAGDATVTSKTLTTEFYYKIIPSIITYYSYITFDGNGGTITSGVNPQTIANTNGTDGKVGTTKLNRINVTAPVGYTFKGWNTEADGTGEFYAPEGAFRPSTVETGGEGRGPVTLYAVWEPKTYLVALNPNGGTIPGAEPGRSVTVNAIFGEPMPSKTKSGADVAVPYREGYKFVGFFTEQSGGTMYYDENVQSVRNWDIDFTDGYKYLHAHWVSVYTVTLDHNDGTGVTEQVTVANGYPMPSETITGDAISTLERRGYIFDGYYEGREDWSQKKYYNADLTSAQSWDKNGSATIYAHWKMKPYTIIFHSNDSENKTASQEISNQYVGIYTSFDRDGYTLTGWSYTSTGNVVFHQGEIVPSDDINISEPDRVLHLYAQWDLKNLNVTFNYTDPSKNIMAPAKVLEGYKLGTSNNSSLSGTIIETPTYDEYLFDGWYEQDGRNKAYDAEGNAVEGVYWKKNPDGTLVWDYHTDVNLYPQWIKDATFVDVKIIRDNNYEGDATHNYVGVIVSGMTTISNFRGKGYITVDGVNYLSYERESNKDNIKSVSLEYAPVWNIDAVDGQENKVLIYTYTPEGQIKYLGNKVENGQVTEDAIGIQDQKPGFYFTIYNERGWICLDDKDGQKYNHILYMKDDTDWEYENTGDNPQYKPIRILAYGTSTSYGNLNSSKVVGAIKTKLSTPDANGRYPYAYNGKVDDELCKGVLYVDMGGASNIIEANATDLSTFKGEVSQNCLFFMPKTYNNTLGTNVVTNMGDKYVSADDLVITDKVPFSSPYTFRTGSYIASYSRVTSDQWGSLCLPFPVKRSGSDMKFYKLYGSDDLRLAFESVDGDIPANKPIACYGSGSFTLTSNSNVEVPADNASREYNETVSAISCENIRELVEDKKQMTTENKTWNFKGVRFCSYVYGTDNTETLPNHAEKSLVYYFSNDKFTYVNSKGRVKFAPFRAYLKAPEGSNAKTFSLLVFDEEGATDITDIIDGNAGVANGKIYDLLGRRVKTPLKGHIYIVDGKKKQY